MLPSFHAAMLCLILGCAACPSPRGAPASTPAAEHYAVTPDGIRLYYRVVGTGPETVIAPFALFHESTLDVLARGRRIVTYDPRGRGRSDSVPPGKVSLEMLLLDLETIRREVGAEQVGLIGWSGGGMETFVYALRNPRRVTRLVQLAPVAPRFQPYGPWMMKDRAARTDSVAQRALDRRVAAGEFRDDPAGFCRARTAITRPAAFADRRHPPSTPDVCRFPNEFPERLSTYFQALFQSLDDFDWRDSLAVVTVPRLVIHGARDNTPLAGNREWVAGQANVRLLVIDGAGHWPHYEQAGATLGAIDTFLSGTWPRGATAVAASEL